MRAEWSPAALQAMLGGLQLLIDGDVLHGKVLCYSGTPPFIPGDLTAEPLQVAIELGKPCGTITGTALNLAVPAEGQRIDGQTIAWVRIINGAGVWVGDFDVGLTGSLSAIELDRLDGYPGAFVRLTAGLIAF